MANERLMDFPVKASPIPADIIYLGDSADAFLEKQSTIAEIISAYPALLFILSVPAMVPPATGK